jgi:hypothetical protein
MIADAVQGMFEQSGVDPKDYGRQGRNQEHYEGSPRIGNQRSIDRKSIGRTLSGLGAAALLTYAVAARRNRRQTSMVPKTRLGLRIRQFLSAHKEGGERLYEQGQERLQSPRDGLTENSTIKQGRGMLGQAQSRISNSVGNRGYWDPATRAFLGTVGVALTLSGARQQKPLGYALSAV